MSRFESLSGNYKNFSIELSEEWYYYVDLSNSCIYLLGFFPKTGRFGRDDLTDTELKMIIEEFKWQKRAGMLVEHTAHDWSVI